MAQHACRLCARRGSLGHPRQRGSLPLPPSPSFPFSLPLPPSLSPSLSQRVQRHRLRRHPRRRLGPVGRRRRRLGPRRSPARLGRQLQATCAPVRGRPRLVIHANLAPRLDVFRRDDVHALPQVERPKATALAPLESRVGARRVVGVHGERDGHLLRHARRQQPEGRRVVPLAVDEAVGARHGERVLRVAEESAVVGAKRQPRPAVLTDQLAGAEVDTRVEAKAAVRRRDEARVLDVAAQRDGGEQCRRLPRLFHLHLGRLHQLRILAPLRLRRAADGRLRIRGALEAAAALAARPRAAPPLAQPHRDAPAIAHRRAWQLGRWHIALEAAPTAARLARAPPAATQPHRRRRRRARAQWRRRGRRAHRWRRQPWEAGLVLGPDTDHCLAPLLPQRPCLPRADRHRSLARLRLPLRRTAAAAAYIPAPPTARLSAHGSHDGSRRLWLARAAVAPPNPALPLALADRHPIANRCVPLHSDWAAPIRPADVVVSRSGAGGAIVVVGCGRRVLARAVCLPPTLPRLFLGRGHLVHLMHGPPGLGREMALTAVAALRRTTVAAPCRAAVLAVNAPHLAEAARPGAQRSLVHVVMASARAIVPRLAPPGRQSPARL